MVRCLLTSFVNLFRSVRFFLVDRILRKNQNKIWQSQKEKKCTWIHFSVSGHSISIHNVLESNSELVSTIVGWRKLLCLHVVYDGWDTTATLFLKDKLTVRQERDHTREISKKPIVIQTHTLMQCFPTFLLSQNPFDCVQISGNPSIYAAIFFQSTLYVIE